jgi:hypothetical protein
VLGSPGRMTACSQTIHLDGQAYPETELPHVESMALRDSFKSETHSTPLGTGSECFKEECWLILCALRESRVAHSGTRFELRVPGASRFRWI